MAFQLSSKSNWHLECCITLTCHNYNFKHRQRAQTQACFIGQVPRFAQRGYNTDKHKQDLGEDANLRVRKKTGIQEVRCWVRV